MAAYPDEISNLDGWLDLGFETKLNWIDAFGVAQSAKPFRFDTIEFKITTEGRNIVETLPIQGYPIFETSSIGSKVIKCTVNLLANIPELLSQNTVETPSLIGNLKNLAIKYGVGEYNNFKNGYIKQYKNVANFVNPSAPRGTRPAGYNTTIIPIYTPLRDLAIIDGLLNAPLSLDVNQAHLNYIGVFNVVVMDGFSYDIIAGQPSWYVLEFTLKQDRYIKL